MFIRTHQSHPYSRGEFEGFSKNKIFSSKQSLLNFHMISVEGELLYLTCVQKDSVSTTKDICKKLSNSINLKQEQIIVKLALIEHAHLGRTFRASFGHRF